MKQEGVEDAEDRLSSKATIGFDSRPMWVGNLEDTCIVSPPRLISARCAFSMFTGDPADYIKIGETVMHHVWMKHGNE